LEYDGNFGALIRKKSKYSIDGIPLIVGISTLLKQFHPSYTKQLFAYLGQYLRVHLHEAFSELEQLAQKTSTATANSLEVSHDLVNCLIFLEQFCIYSSIPRATIHEFIPPFIFDTLKFSAHSAKKK
jgi:WASH complex subunit strumpellin